MASCIKDTFDREGFTEWVVRVDLPQALRNDGLDARVESLEEGGVVLVGGDLLVHEKGVGNG